MKQHIDLEQLNELSDKGKERLMRWETKHHYYLPVNMNDMRDLEKRLQAGPTLDTLSIGQLIEFLDEHSFEVGGLSQTYWENMMFNDLFSGLPAKDVCDLLWQTVKEVLNETM